MIEQLPGRIYLASDGFIGELTAELTQPEFLSERLLWTKTPPDFSVWAQDVWFEPYRIHIDSISDAGKKLRSLGKYWALFPVANHRRAKLIQEQLPKFKVPERIPFPDALVPRPFERWTRRGQLSDGSGTCVKRQNQMVRDLAPAPHGSWALIESNTIIASPACWKKNPHGVMEFDENKTFPPTRAYLKLWEFFTLAGERPRTGERCLDLGSSPGGWSWVQQSLGATVISVDKADLDPKIVALPRLTHLQESAFGIEPTRFGKIDWLTCDVICYPDKLYGLVERWMKAGMARNFFCTVKLQGETDVNAVRLFQSVPNSQLLHLYHNKHELSWVYPARPALEQKMHTH